MTNSVRWQIPPFSFFQNSGLLDGIVSLASFSSAKGPRRRNFRDVVNFYRLWGLQGNDGGLPERERRTGNRFERRYLRDSDVDVTGGRWVVGQRGVKRIWRPATESTMATATSEPMVMARCPYGKRDVFRCWKNGKKKLVRSIAETFCDFKYIFITLSSCVCLCSRPVFRLSLNYACSTTLQSYPLIYLIIHIDILMQYLRNHN